MGKDAGGHGSNPRGWGGAQKSGKTGWSSDKPSPGSYNASSVNKAIDSAYRGTKGPTGKQRSVTHALLKGWRG